MELLIKKYERELLKKLKSPNPLIICGPTGSGKSTYVPKLLDKHFQDKRIIFIQPRRVTTLSLYRYLSKELNISYRIMNSKKINNKGNITIVTDGIFLREFLNNKMKYDIVIVDEIHERNVRTELIISILKNLTAKLIFMSATIDVKYIKTFFEAEVFNFYGEMYPLELVYEKAPVVDYILSSYIKIRKILEEIDKGIKSNDILVFLPGEEDIHELAKLVKKIPYVDVLKIFSAQSDEQQALIFKESSNIKVILSTNICESSVTIPGVKHVIDSGLCKKKIFDGINYFGITKISKESAEQRRGRCNRTGPGACFRLYTEEMYKTFTNNIPEIKTSSLDYFVLYFAKISKNLLKFEFLDYPPRQNVVAALRRLKRMDAIKLNKNIEITEFGGKILENPVDPHLSYFFEKCNENNVGIIGAGLVSLFSLENFNFLENARPSNLEDLVYLNKLIEGFRTSVDKVSFCEENKVPLRGMERAVLIFKRLRKKAKGKDVENLANVFSECFTHNLGIRQNDGSYLLRTGIKVFVSPCSYFFDKRVKKLIFLDVLCTTKAYGRVVGRYIK